MAAVLELASVLGDLLDEMVVVGGLVPSLLIPADAVANDAHAGTTELDIGLALALLDSGRYHTLPERLRGARFEPDKNAAGKETRQRWKHADSGVTVDFLIPPANDAKLAGRLQDLEHDLAAIIIPGLPLAFRDRVPVRVEGKTLRGEVLAREVPVCGAGAFIVLKAWALRNRGENKDAYDLWYVLNHYGKAVEDVAGRLRPLLDDAFAREAIELLREDFMHLDSIGPSRVAEFLGRPGDDEIRADAVGLVSSLLKALQ